MPEPAPTGGPSPLAQLPRAHKSALGLAFGAMAGVGLFALTALHVVTQTERGLPLGLLGQYFAGYDITWPGAFVGMAWAFAVGFVGGWLLGFVHNFTFGIWLLVVRTKRDLRQTSNFLDHI
jgi:hypothetical protein